MRRKYIRSSTLRSVGFDPVAHKMELEFRSGALYEYEKVPDAVFVGLMKSQSKGAFYNYIIKDRYPGRKVRRLK